MQALIEAFTLGNAAILTNVCLLPLYPGLVAFLAGNASNERFKGGAAGLLGVLVLAGVLSMMLLIGAALYTLNQSFGSVLPVLLPVIYLIVIGLGVALIFGLNPFARLATLQAPMFHNPYLMAYAYGLLLAPMTLPCTGPIITAAFVVGAGNFGELSEGLFYFLAFGLGFGWPLALLPLLALPIQRRFTGWLTQHHALFNRVSGVLLIGIGIFGLITEVLPNV
jgi:cytochrome c-type biogenesis protein